jgi:hypothetical protein
MRVDEAPQILQELQQSSMAYLHDFAQDVFISYAHIDNQPDREGERGWVESFERALRLRLLKRFGREVQVWRDPELARSQRFDPVIEEAVKGSAIMISLISQSYLASEYCQQELEWFTAKASQESVGLTVGQHVRVFPLLLYNVPPQAWPEACHGTSGFRFHDAVERGFGTPLRPDRDEFTDRLCGLVEELHTVLTAIEKQAGATEVVAEANARSVFLADVSDDMRRDRRLLKQHLEKENIEVVSGILSPQPSQHEAAVLDALARASLSVHLLGALPGRPLVEDEPDRTYPVEQLRIGLEHARSQLVVLPPGLETQDIDEPEYAEFITSLQERPREAERLEIIQAGRTQIAEEVISKIRRLEERASASAATGSQAGAGRAFVDLHVNDLAFAGDLVGYLHRQDLPAITIPSGDLDPAAGLSLFEEHLRSARVFIVVFGRVARSWVEQRLNEALKLILSHRLSTRVGVYLAPPHKSATDASFPPFFQVMNNTESFDPRTVDALLREPPRAS